MFRSARLKLTAWYLLIIMSVSVSFSIVIYQVLTREVERFARSQRLRIERRYRDMVIQQFVPIPGDFVPFPGIPDPELIAETSRHIIMMLVIVDGIIFVVSGYLGYILAGQTLRPIALMVDEQNRFISDSSHELRTPLTALKSTMEVSLRDKHLTLADARTVLSEGIGDVNKLQSLTDSLLQLAQNHTRINRSAFTTVRLGDVIGQAVKKIHPIAQKKQIEIQHTPTELTVTGDQYSLTELLIILLDNAVKYSEPGGAVEVETKKNLNAVTVLVRDSGMGISEKDQPHIFDRFYRADTARSKKTENGYGLGLSIAKKISETHNGTISVESKPGKGSVFTVRLPA